MSTWTNEARRLLEDYLKRNRLRVAGGSVDPEEVAADLRRHVEEEIASLHLEEVTGQDVRGVLSRIGQVPEEEVPTPAEGPRPSPRGLGLKRSLEVALMVVFGVVLPAITISFELFTGLCAGVFFDPLPTLLHVALVAVVPLANGLAWRTVVNQERAVPKWQWLASSAACGVSVFYAALFLPLAPFAAVGVLYFGLGLLALAPMLSFFATLGFRTRLIQRQLLREEAVHRGWSKVLLGSFMVLVVLSLPGPLTRHWIDQAGSDSPAVAQRAIERLRVWGNEHTMLMECYGRANRLWIELFIAQRPNAELARGVYYRVTGKPFNAAPPPLSRLQPAGRSLFEAFDWDPALGGDAVAGQLRGLSLMQSRLDGMCRADQGWAYVEWMLEFKNDHPSAEHEARTQILLPPGGVVSRLTLWAQGEEREAAFAARSRVREAYQQVAVVQRQDPVLVTTSGPDRVLLQCFPIWPEGGTMKVRIGISAPLIVESAEQAALRLPCILERNFGVPASLEHGLWIESPQPPTTKLGKLLVHKTGPGKHTVRGALVDQELSSPEGTLRFPISTNSVMVLALDRTSSDAKVIRQTLEASSEAMPRRVAVVLDGSRGMTRFFPQIARALEGIPSAPQLAVWLAQDGVKNVFRSEWNSREPASELVGRLRGVGGQDDTTALLQAWEWAAGEQGGVLVWIHAGQSVLLDRPDSLCQRMEWSGTEGPRVLEVVAEQGPNRIVERLAGLESLRTLPRLGGLQEDLERLFATWSGRRVDYHWVRSETDEAGSAHAGLEGSALISSHVVRLWAWDRIRALIESRQFDQAARLAARHQLVTPVSGAVVLETAAQFAEAGLTPADPATVPLVPEPEPWMLLLLGMMLVWLWKGYRHEKIPRRGCFPQ